jgi:hypothetical protein
VLEWSVFSKKDIGLGRIEKKSCQSHVTRFSFCRELAKSAGSPLLALMPRGSYCFVTSFSFVLLLAVLGSFLYAPRDPKQCAMSYSRPEFIKQLALDTSWSRLAGKYSLYLYREGGIDMSKQVDRKGQPVLFIPGHAGSYKQSRSIASETTVQFNQLLKRSGRQGQQAKLDFFTCKYIRTCLIILINVLITYGALYSGL